MTQHTPGPWQRHKSESDSLGYMITVPHRSGLGHLANVYSEEDARLIAAAPDLLAVAIDALGFMQDVVRDHSIADTKTENALRAAIAKATGEAP